MTEHPALDTVHLILNAKRRSLTWDAAMVGQVLASYQPVMMPSWTLEAWVVTVAIFASEGEHPALASARLAKYLLAYQETHGRFPSLEAVQQHAATRHLEEPR